MGVAHYYLNSSPIFRTPVTPKVSGGHLQCRMVLPLPMGHLLREDIITRALPLQWVGINTKEVLLPLPLWGQGPATSINHLPPHHRMFPLRLRMLPLRPPWVRGLLIITSPLPPRLHIKAMLPLRDSGHPMGGRPLVDLLPGLTKNCGCGFR